MAITAVIGTSRGHTCLPRDWRQDQGLNFGFAKIEMPIRHPRKYMKIQRERFNLEIKTGESSVHRMC